MPSPVPSPKSLTPDQKKHYDKLVASLRDRGDGMEGLEKGVAKLTMGAGGDDLSFLDQFIQSTPPLMSSGGGGDIINPSGGGSGSGDGEREGGDDRDDRGIEVLTNTIEESKRHRFIERLIIRAEDFFDHRNITRFISDVRSDARRYLS